MLSRKVKYAIIAAIDLAHHGPQDPRLIADIAEDGRIPKKFLEQILLELKNAGILSSKKGRGGGYCLCRPPESVTLGSIIRTIDGPIAPVRCVSHSAPELCAECKEPEACAIRSVMAEVRDASTGILDHVTLADMIYRSETMRSVSSGAFMYNI